MQENWTDVCSVDDIEQGGVIRFDHAGKTYAVYRSADDRYYATDGLCTHERVHLADGLVMGDEIECPKHMGRFSYVTGRIKGPPVCVNLTTHPVKVEGGRVYIGCPLELDKMKVE
ncbi:MocE family 2Fe-2S type ferredoxin [Mesorhizobium sp. MSK_1335]|uniref:MocE family 2Fe-2S type ferredoxin n=1 Tax=Mesorhizobium montanum TaxID=3072323 RepID=A0ABU4ZT24_9HYPH|nr:MocE family 2Fe-2S type ferredoxin [Mesorhizobium sp. MSK_1335]MDX8528561.1 MocE family 2Fe-2S type ferredoxin [Mesorhizobium sp. MSK_1335]